MKILQKPSNQSFPLLRIVASICLAGWLLEVIYWLVQASAIDRVVVNGVDFTESIWRDGLHRLIWTIGGALLSLAGLLRFRYASVFVVFSCVWYLGFWVTSGVFQSVPLNDVFPLKWRTATTLGTVGSFFLRDVLLPGLFSAALVALAVIFISKKQSSDE